MRFNTPLGDGANYDGDEEVKGNILLSQLGAPQRRGETPGSVGEN